LSFEGAIGMYASSIEVIIEWMFVKYWNKMHTFVSFMKIYDFLQSGAEIKSYATQSFLNRVDSFGHYMIESSFIFEI